MLRHWPIYVVDPLIKKGGGASEEETQMTFYLDALLATSKPHPYSLLSEEVK
jgi:hypothetical protein